VIPALPQPPPRWSPFVGHALTVVALALGGLSSFHALRAEVVELRSNLHALMQIEAEHTRNGEALRRTQTAVATPSGPSSATNSVNSAAKSATSNNCS
jgi:hypothetical protein